ncbi:MAG: outer membrane beta-barrel protein [Flavobacteriaceae bacterium]|nr:outer membrane beta-barrel protein [Flavobacteriaceae bacterium]
MSDKKHIDRLFQEKLKDFEAIPSQDVWENISAKLEGSKKDRKVIPLWWKIAGIAAGFILLLTIGNLVLGTENTPVDQNTTVDSDQNSDPDAIDNTNSQDQNDPIKFDDASNSDGLVEDNVDPANEINDNEPIGPEEKSSKLTTDQNDRSKKAVVTNNNNPTLNQNNKSNAVINNDKRIQDAVTNNQADDNPDTIEKEGTIEKEKADELIKSNTSDAETAVTINKAEEDRSTNEGNIKSDEALKNEIEEAGKESLTDAVENAKEDETEDKEDDLDEKKQRWSVLPNVAPVYFNSFGKGSAIDDQFTNNAISGEINLSYGLAGAYQISDKLTVRAGINQLKLGYSTDDVIVYNNIEPTVEDKPLKNVALNSSSQNLSFLSATGINAAPVPAIVADNISSSLDQKFGFIEIPMELEYKISDKKLDLSIIGGFSTLFLNENEVYSSLQGQRMLLGEATNIKKTSFSANLGLGVKYEMSERFNLNLEPVLKYHLNTFSDTSGDFNPYFIGVYTGFSFKF